ncbi:Ral GTPase-activating protein subunit alpha-2 [Physocladia obscura]|uniref:Ral GTPase-activating protein subunit alpha-2 n=1 Tax=Physocladia obscura TaxID=109957 RepID=A0AAD5XB24_9FUNG|nr:Ral GTPase-activating protein subunit alpha-2 [Physocladia obscura]
MELPFTDDGVVPNNTKRAEKLLKKAKLFLDDKQKAKSRLTSLYSFLDSITPLPSHSLTSSTNQLNNAFASASGSAGTPNSNAIETGDFGTDQQILAKFLQDNYEQVFDVLYENLGCYIEKVKGKIDRTAPTSSKEFTDLLKIVSVLRKLILHIPDKIEAGWEAHTFFKIIQSLLLYGNQSKVRTEGLKLLLTWINNQPVSFVNVLTNQASASGLNSNVLKLYGSVLNFSIFEASPIPAPADMAKSDCLGDEGIPGYDQSTAVPINHSEFSKQRVSKIENTELDATPIFSSSNYPSETDSIELIEEILSNLSALAALSCQQTTTFTPSAISPKGVAQNNSSQLDSWKSAILLIGIEESFVDKYVANRAAFCALAVQWTLLKRFHLPVLFPVICSKFSNPPIEGFSTCPIEILQSLLLFIARHVVDANGSQTDVSCVTAVHGVIEVSQKSNKLFQHIVLSVIENREIIHEILRQGLLAPWLNSDLGRYSMFILRTWAFTPNDERPIFLHSSGNVASLALTFSGDSDAPFNTFLRRYMRYILWNMLTNRKYLDDSLERRATILQTDVNGNISPLSIRQELENFNVNHRGYY